MGVDLRLFITSENEMCTLCMAMIFSFYNISLLCSNTNFGLLFSAVQVVFHFVAMDTEVERILKMQVRQ